MSDARKLHQRLLTLDTHLDTPVHFRRPGWSFGARHELHDDVAQLDIPKMLEGNLRGGFFVIYTPSGEEKAASYAAALEEARHISDDIDAMLDEFTAQIGLALTAQDARCLHANGKLVAFKSIENSYFVGSDVAALHEFHRRGVRLAGLVHSKTNQLADSATDEERWGGLSPLGREWVRENNRLGIIIDGSHSSNAAFDQMLELSSAPMLLSHSGSRVAYDCERNIDDQRLKALANAGGVIGFSTIYLSKLAFTDKWGSVFARHGKIANLDPGEQRQLAKDWNSLSDSEPMWTASFDDYIETLLHVIKVAGVDHVCFGADWDGGGGIAGLRDITDLPKITERLDWEGLSSSDIEKLWSGNILRLLDDVQATAESRKN